MTLHLCVLSRLVILDSLLGISRGFVSPHASPFAPRFSVPRMALLLWLVEVFEQHNQKLSQWRAHGQEQQG